LESVSSDVDVASSFVEVLDFEGCEFKPETAAPCLSGRFGRRCFRKD